MDERCMILWVKRVLAPYVAIAPAHVVPLLFLDSYRVHMMKSVVSIIEVMGVKVQHIPGGCTSLCQPVDVGFNKPFKSRMKLLWTNFMVHRGLVGGKVASPERIEVATWIEEASNLMNGHSCIKNAWRKTDFEWFPDVQVLEIENDCDNDDDDD